MQHLYIVMYDISTREPGGSNRLRRVAKICEAHGQRVQKSVFECHLTKAQYEDLVHSLLESIETDQDSLRMYRVPRSATRSNDWHIDSFGVDYTIDLDGTLLF